SGGRHWERHIRLSGIDPLLDTITWRVLGDQTSDSQEAALSHQAVLMAMVPHSSSRALQRPTPEVMPEGTRAFPILWSPGEHAHARGSPSLCGESVAILVKPPQEQEPDVLGEVPEAAADVCIPYTQD